MIPLLACCTPCTSDTQRGVSTVVVFNHGTSSYPCTQSRLLSVHFSHTTIYFHNNISKHVFKPKQGSRQTDRGGLSVPTWCPPSSYLVLLKQRLECLSGTIKYVQ